MLAEIYGTTGDSTDDGNLYMSVKDSGTSRTVMHIKKSGVVAMENGIEFGGNQFGSVCIVTKSCSRCISSAAILAANTTPYTMIVAPGAGKIIHLTSFVSFLDYNSAAYATNVTAAIAYSGQTAMDNYAINQTSDYYTNISVDKNQLFENTAI